MRLMQTMREMLRAIGKSDACADGENEAVRVEAMEARLLMSGDLVAVEELGKSVERTGVYTYAYMLRRTRPT